jgi:hypothetical protein
MGTMDKATKIHPNPTIFSERAPDHRHRDLEIAINQLSDKLDRLQQAMEKLVNKLERDRELDKERDVRLNALERYLGKENVDEWKYKYRRDEE